MQFSGCFRSGWSHARVDGVLCVSAAADQGFCPIRVREACISGPSLSHCLTCNSSYAIGGKEGGGEGVSNQRLWNQLLLGVLMFGLLNVLSFSRDASNVCAVSISDTLGMKSTYLCRP